VKGKGGGGGLGVEPGDRHNRKDHDKPSKKLERGRNDIGVRGRYLFLDILARKKG